MSLTIPPESQMPDEVKPLIDEVPAELGGEPTSPSKEQGEPWSAYHTMNRRGVVCSDEPHSQVSDLDEIARFLAPTHDPVPRDLIEERGDKLKTLLPMLRWERLKRRNAWYGRNSITNLGEVCVDDSGLVSAWTEERGQDHPTAIVNVSFEEDGDLIAILKIWRDSAYPQAAKHGVNESLIPTISQEHRSLIDRMREAVPELEWVVQYGKVIGLEGGYEAVTANPNMFLLCWIKDQSEPCAVRITYPGDDKAVSIVREWWEKTHPKPTRDPIAERGERLRALLPMLRWERNSNSWLAFDDSDYMTLCVSDFKDGLFVNARVKECSSDEAIDRKFTTDAEAFAALAEWRDHIDQHTLAGDQSPTGLTAAETTTLQREQIAQAQPTEAETPAEILVADVTDAAFRTAASQFVKLSREPLIGLLTRHLAQGDEAVRSRIAAFLQTELGGSLLASMLSALLSTMPYRSDASDRLARELRVRAMSNTFESFAVFVYNALVASEH